MRRRFTAPDVFDEDEVEGAVDVEEEEDTEPVDEEEEPGGAVGKKDSEVLEEAMLQNCWARSSEVASWSGQPLSMHPTSSAGNAGLFRSG